MLYSQALWVAWLGEAYLLAGQTEHANTLAMRALDLACYQQTKGSQAWTLRLLGEISRQRSVSRLEQAETYYQKALALANVLEMRPLQAHCHRGLGMLYARTGQREQAHVVLSEAIALCQAMAMTFWLPQAEAALAQVEGQL